MKKTFSFIGFAGAAILAPLCAFAQPSGAFPVLSIPSALTTTYSLPTPFGTKTWTAAPSAINEHHDAGTVMVSERLGKGGPYSRPETANVNGTPHQLMNGNDGSDLTFWATQSDGKISMSLVLRQTDGFYAMAFVLPYGATKTVPMFDENGKQIGSIKLTASKSV